MALGTTAAIIGAATGGAGIFANLFGASKAAKAANKAAETQAQAAEAAGKLYDPAAEAAAAGVSDAAGQANLTLGEIWQQIQSGITPYTKAGQTGIEALSAMLAPDGELAQKFQFSEDDPSYQFRLQEGQKALERSAAARGGSLGGAQLKALARYGQDYASTEYQKAFDRFQAERLGKYGMLSGLAGMGQNSVGQLMSGGLNYAGQVGGNLMGAAQYGGNAKMWAAGGRAGSILDAANARAAGTVGSANAWNQGTQGAVGAGTSGIMLANLMKSGPTAIPQYAPGGMSVHQPGFVASMAPAVAPATLAPPPVVAPPPVYYASTSKSRAAGY